VSQKLPSSLFVITSKCGLLPHYVVKPEFSTVQHFIDIRQNYLHTKWSISFYNDRLACTMQLPVSSPRFNYTCEVSK